jgi:hypothetical protein
MDTVRDTLKKPLVIGGIALIIGIMIGWFALGWWLAPVEWTDAGIKHLRADLKEEYLRMAIDSFAMSPDVNLAKDRFAALGKDSSKILQQVEASPGRQNVMAVTAFRAAVQAETLPTTPAAAAPQVTTGGGGTPVVQETPLIPGAPTPAAKPTTVQTLSKIAKIAIPVICGFGLLVLIGVAIFLVLRSRKGGGTAAPSAGVGQSALHSDEWSQDYSSAGEEPPMVQFMASYKLGDDLFDDSFSIDSPAGEFLGECGVGISETVGDSASPKKVTAFEVWLFDKNDIQTVTKVLMGANAYADDAIRQRLTAKGEPILAESGSETILETQSLRLVVRVVDMGYGDGAMGSQGFFDRLILELAVWPKA